MAFFDVFMVEKQFSVEIKSRKKFWKKNFFEEKNYLKNFFFNFFKILLDIFIPGRIVSALRASTIAPTLRLRRA